MLNKLILNKEILDFKKKDIYYKNKYGINYTDFCLKKVSQGHRCWICGKGDRRLFLDHRHILGYKKLPAEEKSKEIRGILCFICNTAIGKLERTKDARFILNRIVEYFKIYKMKGDL